MIDAERPPPAPPERPLVRAVTSVPRQTTHSWAEGNQGRAGVRVDVTAAGVVVNAAGEFDTATVHLLERALHTALQIEPYLVLDLRHVTFLDARTLDCIAGFGQRAAATGGGLGVRNVSPFIRRLFRITQLEELLV